MDDPVRVTTVPGEPEADSLCGLLRENGIECGHRETAEDDSAFEGIGGDGIREILVHPDDLARAREVLGLGAT